LYISSYGKYAAVENPEVKTTEKCHLIISITQLYTNYSQNWKDADFLSGRL